MKKTSGRSDQEILKILGLMVAGLVVFLGAVYARKRLAPDLTTPDWSRPETEEVKTEGWQSYTGADLTINYPPDWKGIIDEQIGSGKSIALTDLPTEVAEGRERISKRLGGGSLTIRKGMVFYNPSKGKNLTLREWIQETRMKTEEIIFAEVKAWRTPVKETEEEVEQNIYFEKGGVIFEINMRADKSLRKKYGVIFNEMLATFQFL